MIYKTLYIKRALADRVEEIAAENKSCLREE